MFLFGPVSQEVFEYMNCVKSPLISRSEQTKTVSASDK